MSFPGGAGVFGGGGDIGFGGIRIGAVTNGLRAQMRDARNTITSELNQTAAQAEQSARRTSKAWNTALGFAKVAAVGAGVAIAGGLAASAQAAISFETAFAGVRKTVDFGNVSIAESERRFKGLEDEFRGLAKVIPIGVNDLAAIGEQAGALGIKAEDIKEFVRVSALIGVTTNVSADQAATALGQLSNVLGLTNKDYERFASTLVGLGNKGASTESQILEMASRAGGSAKLVGIAADATLGWASAVADLGIEVEAGGSSLQNFFLKAQKAMGSTKALKLMASVAGVSAKDFKRSFDKDASGALTSFIKGLSGLSAGKQLSVLGDLGLDDIRMSRMLLGLAGKTEGLTNSLKNASEAWKTNTALQVEAEKRFATTASQIQLLQNVLKDLFIGIGQTLLPGINAVVKGLAEGLPRAAKYLERIWNNTLGPAVGRLAKSFGDFWDVIRKLFGSEDEAASFGGAVGGAFEAIAEVMATVLDVTSKVFDVLGKLLSNPVIGALTKLVAGFIAFRVAVSGGLFAVNKLNGASRGFLRMLTGGRLGSTVDGASMDPSAAALKASAGELGGSAVELQGAARALKGAAAAQGAGGGAGGVGRRNVAPGTTGAFGGPLQMVDRGDPNGIGRVNGRVAQTSIANTAEARAYSIRHRRAMAAFGQGAVKTTMAGISDGVSAAGRGVKSLGAGALKGISMAASLFWPLAIAGLGISLAQAPIGDFIANNTQFKRAGALMKEDFIGGLVGLVKSWRLGSDLSTALPQLNVGGRTFKTDQMGNMDLTDAQIAALQGGGLAGIQAEGQIDPQLRAKLQQQKGEDIGRWHFRIEEQLRANGLDTSDFQKMAGRIDWTSEDQALRKTTQLAAIEKGIATLTGGMADDIKDRLRNAVISSVRQWSGGRISMSTLVNLPTGTYDKLAEFMIQEAAGLIDPRTAALTVSGLLNKPKAHALKGVGPVDMEDRRAVQFGRQGDKFYDVKARLTVESSAIAEGKARLADFIKALEPGEAFARNADLDVLKYLTDSIKGAGKDPEKQKALLKEINRAMGLSGQAAMKWSDLIDWKATLGESTGDTAQRELSMRLKKWSVEAAVVGAEGGAAQFWTSWKAQITGADTTKEKEALRKRFNELIPGTANDLGPKRFAAFLKDMQAKAEEESKPGMAESAVDFVGSLLADPAKAIEKLVTQFGVAISGGLGGALGDEGLIAALRAGGEKLAGAIAAGVIASRAVLAASMGFALAGLRDQLPSSPVKRGPLKHPYLLNAGATIVKQVNAGMQRASLTVPPLDMAAVGAGAGGQGRSVTIYADKLQTFGPADEQSLTRKFEFLAADSR